MPPKLPVSLQSCQNIQETTALGREATLAPHVRQRTVRVSQLLRPNRRLKKEVKAVHAEYTRYRMRKENI
jgi:hypothetical protein